MSHPPDAELQAWLGGARGELDVHVLSCDACMERIEHLTSFEPGFRRLLGRFAMPDSGFVDRVEEGVARWRHDTQTWGLIADLLSLGWRTLDAVIGDDRD